LYFGHPESFRGDDELLEKYVWHFWNSPGHVLPGGLLKPNDLGLFDMLGNAMEWLQDDGMFNKEGVGARELDDLEDPSPVSGAHRVLRGFSMFDKPNNQQSEEPILSLSGTRQFSFGFRVARTLPPLDFDVVEQGESVWHKAELTLEGAAGPLVVRSVDRDVKVSPEQITTPASLTVTGPELLAGTVLFTVEGAAANEAYQVLGRLVPDGFRVVRTQDNSIAMKLVLIPRGEFMMGAGQEEIEQAVSAEAVSAFVPFRRSEGPRHRVRVTRPFWIGMHEVTVGQFRQFVDATGYRTEPERDARIVDGLIEGRWQPHKPGYSWREPGFPQTDEHPVVLVTWNDAVEFCKWLSEKEGEAYRLPTEAEWEYACRAGSTARWCFGDAEERLGECAWYRANSGLVPHPVGRKMPNAFGLYDVHGNVCEWCADGWSEGYYQQSSEDDPRGAEGDGPRILRGGNVWGQPIDCRSALRLADGHSGRGNQWGFRIAKTIQGGVLSPPLEIRLDRQAAAGKQTQYRILGADKPFVIRDVQGGVQITPSKGQAPALVKVVAPDRKTRPFSFVVERTDTGQTVVATGLLFSSDWDVKFYAWKPADGVTPPTDWEKVVAAPPLDQQTHPVLDIDSGQAASGTSVPSDSFAAVATTEIDLPAGRYDLWAVADDAARVFLDGRKLIDLWSPGGSSQLIEVQLSEGRHTVRAEYYQINGTAKLQVGIQPFPANEDGAKP
jgi:formylglycine-generating enzyme required for sulfatase activity